MLTHQHEFQPEEENEFNLYRQPRLKRTKKQTYVPNVKLPMNRLYNGCLSKNRQNDETENMQQPGGRQSNVFRNVSNGKQAFQSHSQ